MVRFRIRTAGTSRGLAPDSKETAYAMIAETRIKELIPSDQQSVIFIEQMLIRPIVVRGDLPIVIDLVVKPDVEDLEAPVGILTDR